MLNPFQTHLINRFVFIDCENGNVAKTETVATFLNNNKSKYLTDETTIFCFFGKNKTLDSWKKGISEKISDISNFEFIDTNVNADMVIAAYFGGLCKDYPKAEFIIIAYDRDYSPLVSYFSSLKIKISQEKICNENIKKQSQTKSKSKKKGKQQFKLEEAIEKLMELKKSQCPKTKNGIKNFININCKFIADDSDIENLIKKLQTDKKIEINGKKVIWDYTEKESTTKQTLPQTKSEFTSKKVREGIIKIPLSERPKTIGELKEYLEQNYNCKNIDNSIKVLLNSLKIKKIITNSLKQNNIKNDTKITWKK